MSENPVITGLDQAFLVLIRLRPMRLNPKGKVSYITSEGLRNVQLKSKIDFTQINQDL